jgi:hypothetical protein
VPIGSKGSDIDHLLIGPGGVWTLNTKNHPGKKIWVSPRQVCVDGHVVPYLRNSEFEATRVRRILTEHLGWEPFVKAGLVLLTGSIIPDVTIKQMPDDVLILDRLDITRAFKKSPERLTPDGIAEIYELAKRSYLALARRGLAHWSSLRLLVRESVERSPVTSYRSPWREQAAAVVLLCRFFF